MQTFGSANTELIRCMRRLMEDPCDIPMDEWGAATAMVRKLEDFRRLYERAEAMRSSPRSNF